LTLLKEVSQFKRVLADQVVEVDFSEMLYKKSRLEASREEALARRHLRLSPGDDADAGSLRIERMCRLPQVSWAGFYRSLRE